MVRYFPEVCVDPLCKSGGLACLKFLLLLQNMKTKTTSEPPSSQCSRCQTWRSSCWNCNFSQQQGTEGRSFTTQSGDTVDADVYVWKDCLRHKVSNENWDYSEFCEKHLAAYLSMSEDYMLELKADHLVRLCPCCLRERASINVTSYKLLTHSIA
jgi:hypothetical protein